MVGAEEVGAAVMQEAAVAWVMGVVMVEGEVMVGEELGEMDVGVMGIVGWAKAKPVGAAAVVKDLETLTAGKEGGLMSVMVAQEVMAKVGEEEVVEQVEKQVVEQVEGQVEVMVWDMVAVMAMGRGAGMEEVEEMAVEEERVD